MMLNVKRLSGAVAALVVLFVALPAAAAQVGVGIDVNGNSIAYGNNFGYGISMPIHLMKVTLEPTLAWSSSSYRSTYPNSNPPQAPSSSNNDYYALETGIYARQEKSDTLHIYYGGRVGYAWNTSKYNAGQNKSSGSGLLVGPTFGAEFFFSKQFSLGIDVSALYEDMSYNYKTNNVTFQKSTNSTTYVQGRAKLRYYFQ